MSNHVKVKEDVSKYGKLISLDCMLNSLINYRVFYNTSCITFTINNRDNHEINSTFLREFQLVE